MAFLDVIGKKIAQTSQDVAKKTKNFADSTKLSSMIADEEKNIAALYPQIGKAYYDLHRDDAELALSELVAAVTDAFARIEALKEQIDSIHGMQKCPRCGGNVAEGAMFCNTCGAKMPPKEEYQAAPAGDMIVCGNCGAQIPADQRFCTYCGTEVVLEQQVEVSICGVCGRELPPDAAFCTGCGTPVGANHPMQ